MSVFSGRLTESNNAIPFLPLPTTPFHWVGKGNGGAIFQRRHPIAKNAPILSAACYLCFAFDHHDDDFAIPRLLAYMIACFEKVERKPDIAPASTFWRNLVNLTTGTKRFAQKLGHSRCPYVFIEYPARAHWIWPVS